MSAPLPWVLVTAFVVLADELQFSSAAARLGVSRQTLRRSIDRLEAQLGTPLIVRSTRRVALTPAGIVLRDHAVPIVHAMDRMVAQVRLADSGRPLSVTVSTDLTAPWTTRVADWVRERGTAAVLDQRPASDTVRLVRAGEVDLALLAGDLSGEPNSTVVGHEASVVLFPDTHPAARRSSIRAGDLSDLLVAVGASGTLEHHRAIVQLLQGDPDSAHVVAPLVGTTVPGLAHAARRHGAATIILARDVDQLDTTGLAALPMDPPHFFPVTLIARADLPPKTLRSLTDHLLRAAVTEAA